MGLPTLDRELRSLAATVLAERSNGQLSELVQWMCNASEETTGQATTNDVPITGSYYAEPSSEEIARIERVLGDFIDEGLVRPGANNGINMTLPYFHVTGRGQETFASGTINAPEPEQEIGPTVANTDQVLPRSVVAGTRPYLEHIVNQANGCYEKSWFDACSVMIRKLIEVLIIAAFEAKGEAESIKHDGNFLMLSGLVDAILARTDWNLGRETKAALPLVKSLGDRSAHNRHYMARKADLDRVLPGLRVAVEDLLHQAKLVR